MTRTEAIAYYDRQVVAALRHDAALLKEKGATRGEIEVHMRHMIDQTEPQRVDMLADMAEFFGGSEEQPNEVELVHR